MVHRLRGQADGCSGFFNLSKTNVGPDSSKQVSGGPLQNSTLRPRVKTAKPTNRGKLDLGSFLIGIELSMRDIDPENMEGLFGPLTNGILIYQDFSILPYLCMYSIIYTVYLL